MSMIRKTQSKKVVALCMMAACCMTILFGQKVYAAPDSNPVTLPGAQIFTKPDGSDADDAFTYTLTAKETGNPMPTGSTNDVYPFIASGTGSIDMGQIFFTQTGTYNYEVAQSVLSPKTGYTYDTKVYTVTIYVSTGLEADVIIQNEDGSKAESMAFENVYAPLASDPAVMVDPPVKKTVSGSPGADGTFTFKLEAEDKTNPMPAGSKAGVKQITIVGPGEEDFGTWSYTKTGIYNYTISEVNNKETGYSYDAAIYTITDNVTDVDGQLTVARTVTNTENKMVDSYEFVNKYTSAKSANDALGGSGRPSGIQNAVKTGDDTTIRLYQAMFLGGGLVLIAGVVYLIRSRKKRRINANI